ncbi:hypothetical protein [Methylotuvimicrobium sp. KM1]|uniref:hypothetical protein n=1 Tax=Methylotuvimicrobium sp. KM1 TaxID=3377707 RepID=UPI0038513DC4
MELIKAYVPLCWFRHCPLELPRSVSFFQKNLYYYLLIELFILANITDPLDALIEAILETGLTLMFVEILLIFRKASAGFISAATSFLICENIIATAGLPVIVWLTTTDDLLSYYILFGLMVWVFAVITYLIMRILLITPTLAFVLSIVYFSVTHGGAFMLMLLI